MTKGDKVQVRESCGGVFRVPYDFVCRGSFLKESQISFPL